MTATATSVMNSAVAAHEHDAAEARFALRIDGALTGPVKQASGGGLNADASDGITHEPLTVELGIGMGKEMIEWINASFAKAYARRDLGIVAADFDYKAVAARSFDGALITEITIPKLDGSSKDSAYFDLEFEAETVRYEPAPKRELTDAERAAAKPAAGFRVSIGDLPCGRVKKIDALTWSMKVQRDEDGKLRRATKSAKISPLRLTIDGRDIGPWKQWQAQPEAKQATLTLLGPDMSEVLMTIEFTNVGLVSLESQAVAANKEEIARFDVELYVEKMKFEITK